MYKTTLDQWLVFKTVVEENGFSAAAKALNRSQSTISYSMTKLQTQLNVQLITVEGKRCELTPAGRNLLQRAYPLLNDFEHLEQTADYLSDGVEANITLSVDTIFPKDILFAAITKFNQRFPLTQIHLKEHFRLLPSDDINFDIAISVSEDGLIPGPKLLEVSLVPVAHKDHPIFQIQEEINSLDQLRGYKQIFYQSSLRTHIETVPYMPQNIWSVHSIESAVAAIKSSLCYGWLPRHNITELLDSGIVKEIQFSKPLYFEIPLYLVEQNTHYKGPAIQYLKEMILESSQKR